MVIARLNGQLGNQLFIYATAYAVAKTNGEKLGIYKFEYDTLNRSFGYQLDDICLDKCNKYIGIPLAMYFDTVNACICKIQRKNKAVFSSNQIDVINENPEQKEIVLDRSKRIHLLNGYWQSCAYFDDYREDLIRQITPNFYLSQRTKSLIRDIQRDKYSVSVHIRRGDYVKIGWCLPIEYYLQAMEHMATKNDQCVFYIFSDDISWVKENLPVNTYHIKFVENDKTIKAFEDIWLMSKCNANIIANSSFSWWGAYLNHHTDKVVIAPSAISNTIRDLPKDWIVL